MPVVFSVSYPHVINSFWKPTLISEHDFSLNNQLQWLQQFTLSRLHAKKISYLDFPQNVQFFSNFLQLESGFLPFLKNLWTFLKKIFHKDRAIHEDMNPVNLPYKCPKCQPLFLLSLPIPPSWIALGLWRALNTTNVICTLHLSNICFGEFPQCFGYFVPSSPTVRHRRAKPMSFLKFRSKQLGHSSFTSEAEVSFIFTVFLHEIQLQKIKIQRNKKKI